MRRRLSVACCVAGLAAVSSPLAAAPDQWVSRPTATSRTGWGGASAPAVTAAVPAKPVITTDAKPAKATARAASEAASSRVRLVWGRFDRNTLAWRDPLPVVPPAPPAPTASAPHVVTTVAGLPAAPPSPVPALPAAVDTPPVSPPIPAAQETRTPVARPMAPAQPAPAPPPNTALHRWLDIQAATLATRYRRVDTTAGVVTANQMQHNEALRFRLTFDAKGRYAIGAGLASGSSFTGGWNNAGIGTPDNFMSDVSLRQLYLSAVPVRGLEAQAGGLFFVRGEGTEITGYDNDGYLSGARLTVKRADWLGADELDVTVGYLGETTTPNVLRRADRLNDTNYWQVLVAKKQGRLGWSTDLTSLADVRTLRAAMTARVPGLRVVDVVRGEAYHRFDGDASGYAVAAEKTLRKRVTLGGGLADIDLNYGGLNADRFGKGRRWFATGNVTLLPELTLLTFYQHAFGNDVALPNRSRLDVILQFNALKALQRAKVY